VVQTRIRTSLRVRQFAYAPRRLWTSAKRLLVPVENRLVLYWLGGIALVAQAISPIPTHFSVAWSVRLSSVTFVPLFKPFDRFRCYLTSILLRVQWHTRYTFLTPKERGTWGANPHSCFWLTKKIIYDLPDSAIYQITLVFVYTNHDF